MATHELYIGGPATANYSRSMLPSPPFNASQAVFQTIRPAAHKGNTGYALTRVLDTAQKALYEYLRTHTVAQDDVIGSILIPQDVVFQGVFFRVDTASGTGTTTITPSLRGVSGGTLPAIAGNTVGSKGFAKLGQTAWVSTNATLAPGSGAGADFFIGTPTVLDLTLTALPAGGLGALRLVVSPIISDLVSGQY